MSNQKSIVTLLKLSFYKIMFWFNVFHDNMKDWINASNFNVDYIKIVLLNVFINLNLWKWNLNWFTYKIDFYVLFYHMTMYLIFVSIIDSNIIILKI
jgi:hypothetical protein